MAQKMYWGQCIPRDSDEYKLLYKLDSGRLSFGADETGLAALMLMISGAYGWSYENEDIIVCEDGDWGFLSAIRNKKGSGSVVTFHSKCSDRDLKDTLSFSSELSIVRNLDQARKKEILATVFQDFEMVCVWDLEMNPVIFSVSRDMVQTMIQNIASTLELEVEEVFEQEMPVW